MWSTCGSVFFGGGCTFNSNSCTLVSRAILSTYTSKIDRFGWLSAYHRSQNQYPCICWIISHNTYQCRCCKDKTTSPQSNRSCSTRVDFRFWPEDPKRHVAEMVVSIMTWLLCSVGLWPLSWTGLNRPITGRVLMRTLYSFKIKSLAGNKAHCNPHNTYWSI